MKKPKKIKKQKKAKPAPKKAAKAKPAKKPEETMERKSLKVIASQLKEMGSELKVLKSDTDEMLQKKVNEALQKLPQGDVLKKLETIDPGKLVQVLKRDCIGIFIDLSDVSCVRCKHAEQCAAQFIKNVKGGMDGVAKAMPEKKSEPEKSEPVKLVKVTKFKSKRLVFVRDVKNPNPKGDDYHDTFQRVLDQQPETLGELRKIVEEDFTIDTDEDFMKFVTGMRDPKEGIIKLDVDLSDKDKAALREAGYDL